MWVQDNESLELCHLLSTSCPYAKLCFLACTGLILILTAWLLMEAAQVSPSGVLPGNVMETISGSDIEKYGH